ncbi:MULTISPECIES: hypothetical protein [Bacillota]|uniref:hypothetical protein n=1 Tax=Bacillota TaxID=1239 RepID=UPI00256FF1B9|nr:MULTISPECIES: hypothetical protein [Bacillota]
MKFKEVKRVWKVLDKFENKCPICGGTLLQGDVDEYYTVLCKCGLEIKVKFKDEEQV